MNCLCLKVVQMVYGNIDGYNPCLEGNTRRLADVGNHGHRPW